MKKYILSAFTILTMFAYFFVISPKTTLAGCACEFNAATPDDSRDGVLREIPGDDRNCADIFGSIKAGLAINAAQPTTVIPVTDPKGCDPFSSSIDPGFTVPTFSTIMGSLIRLIFFIAGLMALVFMLLGGLAWVQSAGDEKKVGEAQKKITASVIGLVVMIAVLSLVIFLEQVVFGGKFCLGISCPMNINFLQLIR